MGVLAWLYLCYGDVDDRSRRYASSYERGYGPEQSEAVYVFGVECLVASYEEPKVDGCGLSFKKV